MSSSRSTWSGRRRPDAPEPPDLLLDPHVWIWAVEGAHDRISAAALAEVEAAGNAGRLLVSAMTVWEAAMLEARGRIALGLPIGEWIPTMLHRSGARLLPLGPEIAIDSTRLPASPHADPVDRILMASARVTGARLVTCDARILRYASDGHVHPRRPSPIAPLRESARDPGIGERDGTVRPTGAAHARRAGTRPLRSSPATR
ncbi:MAG TPA: type II toxin-antitoxin system VapC family toxin [Gemmatimonadaceae bacterium]|nr:type II toxin-antitoxin system VapC family toxin [Gemmatimonadaceae bacterium]